MSDHIRHAHTAMSREGTRVYDDAGVERARFSKWASSEAEFVNASTHEFVDISSEASRTYNFGAKGFVKIDAPAKLSVSSSGGHRVFSRDGKSHYIPSGWIQLSWVTREGQPHFVA